MRTLLLKTALKGFAVGGAIVFGLGMTPVPAGWTLGRMTSALVPTSGAQVNRLAEAIERMGSPLKNWGLFNKEAPSHIHAPEAWTLTDGKRGVVVAVIDTGIDPAHNALMMNLWKNPHSAPGKPEWGWNFISDTPNPTDEHGHGTHVSGIIGAVSDPARGLSGVAHQVSIMPVKYYSERNSGEANLRNTVRAIHYAIDHGAQIINYSGGGPEFSEEEYLAIKRAEARGILFVAAAGNEGTNIDLTENYYYPSAYRLSNIISVAATDIHNELLPTSNWGKTRVDLTAPGESIYSTLPGNRAGMMSGTSQATAFVTGVAALLLSENPTLKPQQIREIINASVDPVPGLKDKVLSHGKLNAYAALMRLRTGNRLGGPSLLKPGRATANNAADGAGTLLDLLVEGL